MKSPYCRVTKLDWTRIKRPHNIVKLRNCWNIFTFKATISIFKPFFYFILCTLPSAMQIKHISSLNQYSSTAQSIHKQSRKNTTTPLDEALQRLFVSLNYLHELKASFWTRIKKRPHHIVKLWNCWNIFTFKATISTFKPCFSFINFAFIFTKSIQLHSSINP